jgi:hypothetical protein
MNSPINFNTDVQSPFKSVLSGFQAGTAIRQQQEQRQAAQQRQADLVELSNNDSPTEQDYSRIITKYPDIAQSMQKSWEVLNQEQKDVKLKQVFELDSALQANDLPTAKKILEDRRQAAKNAGNAEEEAGTSAMIKKIELNPNAAKFATGASLISVIGADEYSNLRSKAASVRGVKGFKVLNPKEKKEIGLDLSKSFQMGPDGKISPIGKGGVNVNIDTKGKFGTVPPGYVLKETDGKFTMEPIPGSPAEQKVKKLLESKSEVKTLAKRAGEVVVEDIERLKSKIKDSSFFNPVLGVSGALVSNIPGTNRVDAEELKQTIVANIGFDRLQQMREASPTGGALGQVSDRELSTLQAVLGSLSLNQSEKQLLSNLNRLDKVYGGILKKAQAYDNAADFGFGVEQVPEITEFATVEEVESAGLPVGTIVTIGGRKAVIE